MPFLLFPLVGKARQRKNLLATFMSKITSPLWIVYYRYHEFDKWIELCVTDNPEALYNMLIQSIDDDIESKKLVDYKIVARKINYYE